jgi:heavy metal sensor kinase
MHNLFLQGKSSLRVRLTAWYMLLMGVTLFLCSTYLYFQLKQSLLFQVDGALQVEAFQCLASLQRTEKPPLKLGNPESNPDASRCLNQTSFAVRLMAPDGTLRDGAGDYLAMPIKTPKIPGYVTLTQNKTHWRIYSHPIEKPKNHIVGWLQVAQTLGPMQEALENLHRQTLMRMPVIVLLAGLGGLFLANRALKPIDRISRTAQAISTNDLTGRINYRGPTDEVGQLAATFDRMLDRLQAGFEREQRFTADVSHELRTPLTVIKGRIGVALSRIRTPREYENTLQDIETAVDRLIRLTNDLLFLARLDQGRLSWQPEVLDLSNLLLAVTEQVQPLVAAQDIYLVEDIPPDLLIHGEPDHLISLFLNLLDNAIKHTPTAGKVMVRAQPRDLQICVTVSDTGTGISPEHLPHLFERFYRVEAARSRCTGGAGLGLAIAYEIVHLHGGTLEVQSNPNQGTCFVVCLPAHWEK